MAVNKRYSHGLTVTVAYTLSKNLQALNYLNPQDSQPARSLVPWDRTQRLVLAPIYELPFGPGKRVPRQDGTVGCPYRRRLAVNHEHYFSERQPDDRAE